MHPNMNFHYSNGQILDEDLVDNNIVLEFYGDREPIINEELEIYIKSYLKEGHTDVS